MTTRLASTLANSGLAINRIWFVRLLRRFPFAAWLFRLRLSPEVLSRLNLLPPDPENGRLYASAVTRMRVGTVVKSVGVDRNELADACVVRIVRAEELRRICDVGVSDGSASLRLLRDLPGVEIHLFDRFNFFQVHRRPLGCEIRNAAGELVYRRLGPLLIYLYGRRPTRPDGAERLEVRNPLLRPFGARIETLDVFEGDLGLRFHLIKCCNLLNVEYFSGEMLLKGVDNLLRHLEEDGFLVIGQNHPSYKEGEAYFVLRRTVSGIGLFEQRNGHRLLPLLRREGREIL